ncbi:unnamed protein product [Blepharisma stoltei]|uniref:DNA-directed RNA polymerase RBP11-like dimerisation domain-containing protein n=1 Tax=Blepharisma stoltei TaxID=1481888 RepID=A0AAU9JGU7_9CILI|nr:unnamed protein product [Blepharisma stoltei]
MESSDNKKFSVAEDETGKGCTFAFTGEGHTIGNALRYLLIKNQDVEFCGYSVPHPAEPVMNIRLQTYKNPPLETLEASLNQLTSVCDLLLSKLDSKNI